MKDIEKYFRVYAEVNLDAIIKNIEMMREKIKPETGIVGVIKTDGYGHGPRWYPACRWKRSPHPQAC